jgi:hypothetical protein
MRRANAIIAVLAILTGCPKRVPDRSLDGGDDDGGTSASALWRREAPPAGPLFPIIEGTCGPRELKVFPVSNATWVEALGVPYRVGEDALRLESAFVSSWPDYRKMNHVERLDGSYPDHLELVDATGADHALWDGKRFVLPLQPKFEQRGRAGGMQNVYKTLPWRDGAQLRLQKNLPALKNAFANVGTARSQALALPVLAEEESIAAFDALPSGDVFAVHTHCGNNGKCLRISHWSRGGAPKETWDIPLSMAAPASELGEDNVDILIRSPNEAYVLARFEREEETRLLVWNGTLWKSSKLKLQAFSFLIDAGPDGVFLKDHQYVIKINQDGSTEVDKESFVHTIWQGQTRAYDPWWAKTVRHDLVRREGDHWQPVELPHREGYERPQVVAITPVAQDDTFVLVKYGNKASSLFVLFRTKRPKEVLRCDLETAGEALRRLESQPAATEPALHKVFSECQFVGAQNVGKEWLVYAGNSKLHFGSMHSAGFDETALGIPPLLVDAKTTERSTHTLSPSLRGLAPLNLEVSIEKLDGSMARQDGIQDPPWLVSRSYLHRTGPGVEWKSALLQGDDAFRRTKPQPFRNGTQLVLATCTNHSPEDCHAHFEILGSDDDRKRAGVLPEVLIDPQQGIWFEDFASFASGQIVLLTAAKQPHMRSRVNHVHVYGGDGKPPVHLQRGSLEGLIAFAPNDLWVRSSQGLLHFDGTAWKPTGPKESYAGSDLWNLSLTRIGTQAIAERTGVFYLLAPNRVPERLTDVPAMHWASAIVGADFEHSWWLDEATLHHRKEGRWSSMPAPPRSGRFMAVDPEGNVWLSTSEGWTAYSESSAEYYEPATLFTSRAITTTYTCDVPVQQGLVSWPPAVSEGCKTPSLLFHVLAGRGLDFKPELQTWLNTMDGGKGIVPTAINHDRRKFLAITAPSVAVGAEWQRLLTKTEPSFLDYVCAD